MEEVRNNLEEIKTEEITHAKAVFVTLLTA